jgi:hypothetical protein
VALAAGAKVGGKHTPVGPVLAFAAGSLYLAWALWRVRYWAAVVLQALLAFAILLFAVLLMVAGNLIAVLVSLLMIVLAGTLFWFLVKAMARMQMPETE